MCKKETPRLEEDRRGGYDREEASGSNKASSELHVAMPLRVVLRHRHRRRSTP